VIFIPEKRFVMLRKLSQPCDVVNSRKAVEQFGNHRDVETKQAH